MSLLTDNCQTFCTVAAADSGLSLRVWQAWTIAETSGGRNGLRGENYVNIGNTDSNPYGGSRWPDPTTAAHGTVTWLRRNPLSGAPILATVGKPDPEQLAGIYNSPFASSRYRRWDPATQQYIGPNGVTLIAAYDALGPAPAGPVPKPPLPEGASVFTPPIQIIALLEPTASGGAYGLLPDGGIANFGRATLRGSVHGQPFFAGRTPDHLEWPTTPGEISAAQAQGWDPHDCYVIVDTAGERYGPVFP